MFKEIRKHIEKTVDIQSKEGPVYFNHVHKRDFETLLQFADEAMELIKDCKTLVNETYGNSPRFDDFLKRWEGK
jgi:hypothetical protein